MYNKTMAIGKVNNKENINDIACDSNTNDLFDLNFHCRYLNMTITSNSGIRKQDGKRAFTAVAKNSLGYEIAFDFLMLNIKQISDYFGDGFSTLSRMVDSITRYMNKEHHLEQLEQFRKKAEDLGLKAVGSSIELAVQNVKKNVFWRTRSYYKLQAYLKELTDDARINLSN